MTSVICNACTKSITAKADRIYCFGGCEQILHSRCADLSSAAVTALRENSSLKYVCLGCRKNDFGKQYAQLAAKVANLSELVNKHESMLTGLSSADSEKPPPRTVPSIKNTTARNATKTDASRRSSLVRGTVTASYADVTRCFTTSSLRKEKGGKSTTQRTPADSDTALTPSDHGGLLRSGRRRIISAHANATAPSTPLNAPQTFNAASPAKQKKPNAIAKLEQTVLFKPKTDQTAAKTKSDICEKFDPVAFAVKDVRFRESGEVAVRCGSRDLALNLLNEAAALSENYSIEIQNLLKPRIKIIGYPDNLSADALLEKLRKQNNLTDSIDLKVVRVSKNEKRKPNGMSAILETDSCGFETLMKLRRVYVEWSRCWLLDATDANRCYNCSEFGHKSAVCSKTVCCPKCAGDHKADDCDADFEKCINCHLENANRGSKHDELLDIDHPAWSEDCPVLRKRLARARQRIDFTS